MTSLTGRPRRGNGSVKTASRPRSRRRTGIPYRAINISCEKTKDRATNRGSAVRGALQLSIAVTLVAGALIATYFRAEVAAYVTRYAGQEDISSVNKIGGYITELLTNQGSRKSNLVAQGQVEADQASAPAEAKQAAQAQQIAAVPVAEAQRSLRRIEPKGRHRSLRKPDALSRGSTCSCRRKREERAIARRGPRKSGRSRAGGRRRAKRADREHGATSSSARRGTRTRRSHWRVSWRPHSGKTRSRRAN